MPSPQAALSGNALLITTFLLSTVFIIVAFKSSSVVFSCVSIYVLRSIHAAFLVECSESSEQVVRLNAMYFSIGRRSLRPSLYTIMMLPTVLLLYAEYADPDRPSKSSRPICDVEGND